MTAEEKAKERLAKFQMAKKKAEEEKNSHSSFPKEEMPEFECCVLNKEKPKIIRLIGNSPLMRENPTDPYIVKRSMCIDDNGKWSAVILSDDRDHPINKLFRTIVGKYKYNKENKIRTYDNAGKPSFERFMTNGKSKEQLSAYERGMQPDTYYMFNCIDKTDNWCKENKHTKLLCWDSTSKEVDGETRTYYTYGIKPSLYNEIFDIKCTNLNRMFDQFDVVVKRLKEKLGDSYLTVCIPEEKTAISNMGLDPSKVSMEYLTDEEENYERYVLEDIPFVTRPTSAMFFNRNFSKLIKQCDIDFGTNLQSEFAEWIEKEKKEWESRKAETKEIESAEDTSTEVESEDEVTEETPSFDSMETVETEESSDDELPSEIEEPTPTAPIQKVSKVAKVAKVAKFDSMSLKNTILPFVDKLTDEERSHIVGINSDGSVKFDDETALCPQCNHEISDSINSACPFCGVEFC